MENNTLSINVSTGEQVITLLDEIQTQLQQEISAIAQQKDAEFIAEKENFEAKTEAQAEAKAAAEAKLAALGLTTDDLKALLLGGN